MAHCIIKWKNNDFLNFNKVKFEKKIFFKTKNLIFLMELLINRYVLRIKCYFIPKLFLTVKKILFMEKFFPNFQYFF